MLGTFPKPSCIHFGFDKSFGSFNFCHSTCNTKFPLPVEAENLCSQGKGIIPSTLVIIICEFIEAVAQTYSVKKVFLEFSQNLQENTCARVSFLIKLQA